MPTVLGVHLILVFVAIGQEGAAVAAAAPACTTFLNTDFNGHDLHAKHGLGNPGACCSLCKATQGCGFWTFMPGGGVCYMKTSDTGRRPSPRSGADTYTSGCKGTNCTAPPPPPPHPHPPGPQPPGPPPPHGGGECASEWDCSLGGVCSAGKCICDPQYTGSHCSVLQLRRAKLNNGMQVNGTHTWGENYCTARYYL